MARLQVARFTRVYVAGTVVGAALLASSATTIQGHEAPFPQAIRQEDQQRTIGTVRLAQARDAARNPQGQTTSGGAREPFACVVNLKALQLEFVPLREQPNQKARETERVSSGTALRIKTETGARDWVNVELLVEPPQQNVHPRSGWVIAKYLQRVTDPALCKTETAAAAAAKPSPASDAGRGDFGCVANLPTGPEEFLSLRQSAAASAREVDRLRSGTVLRVKSATPTGDWLYVDVAGEPKQKAQAGWVNARFVQRVTDPALCGTQVAAPAPTPTSPPAIPASRAAAPSEITKAAGQLFNSGQFCKEVLPLFFKSKYFLSAHTPDELLVALQQFLLGYYQGIASQSGQQVSIDGVDLNAQPQISETKPLTALTSAPSNFQLGPWVSNIPSMFDSGSASTSKNPALAECIKQLMDSLNIDLQASYDQYANDLFPHGTPGGNVVAELDSIDTKYIPAIKANDELVDIELKAHKIDVLGIPVCIKPKCPDFTADHNQVLGGRDIIFVHGLDFPSASSGRWPHDRNAFFPGGELEERAQSKWKPYIDRASAWGSTNRFIFADYSSYQRAEIGTHAVLSQILDAMKTGTVYRITSSGHEPHTIGPNERPFCNPSCVIVSGSTGGLVAQLALANSRSEKFGPGTSIVHDRVKFHVAFRPALGGSGIATVAFAIAAGAAFSGPALAPAMPVLGTVLVAGGAGGATPAFLATTVLADLIPAYTAATHQPKLISTADVPIIVIASAKPDLFFDPFRSWAIPGTDDSILPTESQCGVDRRTHPIGQRPAGFIYSMFDYSSDGLVSVGPLRMMDLGIQNDRAKSQFINQVLEPSVAVQRALIHSLWFVSGTCNWYLSSTGMLQPYAGSGNPVPGRDPTMRLPNVCVLTLDTRGHFVAAAAEINDLTAVETRANIENVPIGECPLLQSADTRVPGDTGPILNPILAADISVERKGQEIGPIVIRINFFHQHLNITLLPEIWFWRRYYVRFGDYLDWPAVHYQFRYVGTQ